MLPSNMVVGTNKTSSVRRVTEDITHSLSAIRGRELAILHKLEDCNEIHERRYSQMEKRSKNGISATQAILYSISRSCYPSATITKHHNLDTQSNSMVSTSVCIGSHLDVSTGPLTVKAIEVMVKLERWESVA